MIRTPIQYNEYHSESWGERNSDEYIKYTIKTGKTYKKHTK